MQRAGRYGRNVVPNLRVPARPRTVRFLVRARRIRVALGASGTGSNFPKGYDSLFLSRDSNALRRLSRADVHSIGFTRH